MGKTSKQICFILLLLASLNIYAQEKKPLSQIISTLQEKHKIKFNYAEDLIDAIFLKPLPKDLSLQEALQYLENNTGLKFIKMDDNFVLVIQKNERFLCGYLKDKESLKPLAFATIQSKQNATVSDENGFFKLNVESDFEQINIRFLGYMTLEKSYSEFKTKDCAEIYMLPNSQKLSEVLLSNYITTGINKLNDGSFEIDFSNFDILPGLIDNDVLQSIQAFPGIQSINETVSNINIRGGTHDQNLILWDGIKMYQSGHFFGLISMYNPQITQRVSLRKNGSDVTYTDGVSGTIAMSTTDKINENFNGNIAVNLINTSVFTDLPIGKRSSIQIAGRKSISDFIKTPTYNEFFKRISQNTEVENNMGNITNSDKTFDFYDTSLRWIYKISDKDELRVNFINVANELQFKENAIINNEQESRESSLSQNSIAGAIYYNHVWNSNLNTTFEGYETDYKLKAVNVNVIDSQRFQQENIVSETSLKVKARYKINENLHLLNGYHFVETEVTNLDDVDDPIYRFLVSEVVRTHSIFSQLGYKSLNKKTSLNAGLRYNYIDKFKKQILEPRLSFTHRFLENFTFELLGEFKHQNTSQIINFQNDFLGIEKRRWQLSNNKDIPVIRSKQVSIGINFSNNGWLVSTEAYYKIVKGITSQSQGFQNKYEFIKTSGSYDVIGLDVLFRKHINKFNLWLSYSFMDNNYTFKSLENESFPSNLDITHAFTVGSTYTAKKLKIAASLNWHTGRPITMPIDGNEISNNEINYAETNSTNLKNYMRADVSALYDFKISSKIKTDLGLSIWNLFDRKNEIYTFYRLNNNTVNETKQYSLGITPNAIFRIYF